MLKVVEMTEEMINNCFAFLNRANLNGAEAEAMVTVKNALRMAVPKAEHTDKKADKN